MSYRAPIEEQQFVLETTADFRSLGRLPLFETASTDLAWAILQESGKLAENVFAPLNRVGDKLGAQWVNGDVSLPDGFAEGYRHYAQGGWSALTADPELGGQGLPFVLGSATKLQIPGLCRGSAEIWSAPWMC